MRRELPIDFYSSYNYLSLYIFTHVNLSLSTGCEPLLLKLVLLPNNDAGQYCTTFTELQKISHKVVQLILQSSVLLSVSIRLLVPPPALIHQFPGFKTPLSLLQSLGPYFLKVQTGWRDALLQSLFSDEPGGVVLYTVTHCTYN